MSDFLLALLTQFGLYGLIALSLALVFGTSRFMNLAVGDFVVLGAYAAVALSALPFWLGLPLAMIILAPLFYVLDRGLLSRISDPMAGMLVTWGIGIVIRQVLEVVFTSTGRSVDAPLGGSVNLLGVEYPVYRIVIALIAIVLVGAVIAYVYGSRAGLRLRAVAENPSMAAFFGARPGRTRALAFTAGGVLVVAAGYLYSPVLGVSPAMGFSLLVPGFVAVLMTRAGSFIAPVIAVVFVVAAQVLLRQIVTDAVAETLFYVVVLTAVVIRANPHIRRFITWIATRPRSFAPRA